MESQKDDRRGANKRWGKPKLFFLARAEFSGVERIPPPSRLGSGVSRWSYLWSGIHPGAIGYTHTIQVAGSFTSRVAEATHQITVVSQPGGQGQERLLYQAQLNLGLFCQGSNIATKLESQLELVAERLACALVLYLLRHQSPASVPGMISPVKDGEVSPWSIVIRQTLSGIKKEISDGKGSAS